MEKVNIFRFEDLAIGQKASFSVLLTEEKHTMFTQLSGDINPLHMDEEYAKSQGFQGRVVYGMCTSAFYSTLVGVYLPGKFCLFIESAVQWKQPAYIGDILTIYGEIVELDDRFRTASIKAKIKNQESKVISKAKLKVLVMEDPQK